MEGQGQGPSPSSSGESSGQGQLTEKMASVPFIKAKFYNEYRDQRFQGSQTELEKKLMTSATLYVGNLGFYTQEYQIHEMFSKCGDIRRVIMGLDRFKKIPCGFCFVEYYERKDAENAMLYINGMKLDDRIIRTDYDAGFEQGRQFGRGKTGGQVRDEYRKEYDADRGGYGKIFGGMTSI